jgi:Zn-finger nucleic acid-binding protein
MICPKCGSAMRAMDKDGVHIDQCQTCRGIFLDQGELERITSAENSYYEQSPPPYRVHADHDVRRHRYVGGGKRRKRSFLEELFG